MKIYLTFFLLPMLLCLVPSNSIADALSLQGLRFFYSPQQRNPEPTIPEPIVDQLNIVPKKSLAILKSLPSIRYVGEIRSNAKRRLFWKQDIGRYLSTVLAREKSRGKDGSAKRKEASRSKKAKESR